MTFDRAGFAEQGESGPSFAEVLRECLDCALVAVDDQGKIIAFNSKAEALTGLKASEVLNATLEALPASLKGPIQETLSTKQALSERQIHLPSGQNGSLTIRLNTAPTQDAMENSSGALAVLNDVTSARELEQNMRRLDRLASIGTLSASMAHEIKNALVAVRTFVELLLERNQDAELAEIVSREMHRIDSIVSQMLRFAGPAKPTFGNVRVHETLDQSLRLIQHQLEGKKVSLHRSFKAASDLVRGDGYQLEQAFINLFFNAIEAMGPCGELSVATQVVPDGPPTGKTAAGKPQPHLQILIKDSGVGIFPENLGRLFEPFFTTKPNGTGLGLSITRRIIREHGGDISVESELNQGTTFSIFLPLLGKSH